MKLIAYHGTSRSMAKPTAFKMRNMDFGPGFYLATHVADALSYGAWVYEAKVQLDNPIVISATDADPALVAWFKRALRISDADLSFYAHPIVGAFELFKTLVEVGTYRPATLINALTKQGYDGIYVEADAIRQYYDLKVEGDYVVIWSPDQLLSWVQV